MRVPSIKVSLQEGFSPIIIIVGIVVVVGCVALIYSQKAAVVTKPALEISNNPTYTEADLNNDREKMFDRVDSSSYTFYYPKGYVKDDSLKDFDLAYKNSNSKAVAPEEIMLNVMKNPQKLSAPDYKGCLAMAEKGRQSSNEKIEVQVINQPKFHGCFEKSITPIDGVNDSIVAVFSTLWFKDQTKDKDVYEVRAVYYGNASKSQADLLDLAVEEFALN
jgi:hypothetical protein